LRLRLKQKLSTDLSPQQIEQISNSFDIVGDIAIIKTSSDPLDAEAVAKQIMAVHLGVKSVYAQISPVKGEFRVRTLKLLAGEPKTSTRHKEAGCIFSVDIKACYFSPRLSFERARVASLVKTGETVVNMFAGVGCFSIIIAKKASPKMVYSIDINPTAAKNMEENVRLNRVYGKVKPMLGDSKKVVSDQLRGVADRVLMPLPEKALEYLPYAVSTLKDEGGCIHYYDFQHATAVEDPNEKTRQKVGEKLDSLGVGHRFVFSRVVRSTGPNWYQTVLDIEVGKF
jgi:tRNA (guanine37-N1)-methyltransferase